MSLLSRVERSGMPLDAGIDTLLSLSDRFAVTFAVRREPAAQEGHAAGADIGLVMRKLAGGPPGIRTLNQWIKSPLLCR
jgi:hypothetical protein